jgi:Icc-related predicted phosphoesterase
MRLAATADLHYTRTSKGSFDELFRHASGEADALLLCGDLTDYGLREEAEMLSEDLLANCDVPVVAVLGNHDFESGHQDEVMEVLTGSGMILLDGDACQFDGVGIAGAKGFAGGFGRALLAPWGEPMIKAFVQESVDEALKLESALRRLKTEHRVVLLHYSPVIGTVEGDKISFSFDSQAGKVSYEGTVDGDTMKGTCTYGQLGEGTFEGKKK